MVIDIHTHCFPERIAERAFGQLSRAAGIPVHTAGTAGALARSAKEAGIGVSVVQPVATDPMKVDHLNAFAAEINLRTTGTGVMSFAALHPLMPDLPAGVKRIREMGFKGVKLHPVYQETPTDGLPFLRALECCYAEGLAVLVHAGWDIGVPGRDDACVRRLGRMLRALPPRGLILAHMGGWGEWDTEEYLGMPELWLDTAFCLHTGAETFLRAEDCLRMIRAHGADRVLFGTDSPWSDQREELARLRALGLSPEEEEAVEGGNACRLLGLTPPARAGRPAD